MTHAEKLAALQRWQAEIERADALLDPVIKLLGLAPESPICTAAWQLQGALTLATATLVGDRAEWLHWYAYENDMGRRGHEAGTEGDMRPICTLQDLLQLMEAV